MPEHQVHGDRAVYDHETEDPRTARRRRSVADWGVGEELFDRMPSPRRRFGHAAEAPPARRESHPRERRFEAARDEAPGRERAREAARGDDAPARERTRMSATDLDAPTRELVAAAPRGGVEGRRTVVIGRQSELARRERPSLTVGERVGPRPDRIAAYAVALGVLLIVIAFLSS